VQIAHALDAFEEARLDNGDGELAGPALGRVDARAWVQVLSSPPHAAC
jgi:hypothetical protein